MLTPEILKSIDASVLCWLATVDEYGQPNVSPKEIFVAFKEYILIANIASPNSVRNIRINNQVCVSFINIFTQKGHKVFGMAEEVQPSDPSFEVLVQPLETLIKGLFPIRSILRIEVHQTFPIIAPSYYLIEGTTEQSQIESAMNTYGVQQN